MTSDSKPQERQPKLLNRERDAILGALGAGVVPRIGLQHIQVGRKDEIDAVLNDIKRIEDGGAAIRFVVGRFGSGKSFFLNLLQKVALERKLVVARADITTQRRLHSSGGEARSLFSELMHNLATRSKAEGGALAHLVERWVSEIAHEVTSQDGSDSDVADRLQRECQPLQDLVSGYDFVNVLTQYYRGYQNHDDALQSAAIRWLRAEYTTKTEARQDLGVRSIIDDQSIYDYLKLLAAFVRIAGYRGLLVCLDELVVLSHRLNHRVSRNNNYEAILRIVNDCLQGSVEGLGFVFAATDDCMYDSRRGLFSYEALQTRLANNRFAAGDVIDLSGPVLELSNLSQEDLYVLLSNLRRVHARNNDTDVVLPDEGIEAFLQSCHQRMGAEYYLTPRETIKDFIGLLNVLEQNPAADWQSLIKGKTRESNGTPHGSAHSQIDENDDLTSFKL